MYVIKKIQARQAHAVPSRVSRTMGPFPPEIFKGPEVINPYAPTPEEWLVCSECGGKELEVNIPFHVCYEDEEEDDYGRE